MANSESLFAVDRCEEIVKKGRRGWSGGGAQPPIVAECAECRRMSRNDAELNKTANTVGAWPYRLFEVRGGVGGRGTFGLASCPLGVSPGGGEGNMRAHLVLPASSIIVPWVISQKMSGEHGN